MQLANRGLCVRSHPPSALRSSGNARLRFAQTPGGRGANAFGVSDGGTRDKAVRLNVGREPDINHRADGIGDKFR
jgi:hypothetical protein